MAKKKNESVRFVPKGPFATVDKSGAKRHFNPDFKQSDGTLGYTAEQVDGLYKRTLDELFESVSVSGTSVKGVEQATAAPGEKRSVATDSK